jgi:hypothetical protein
LVELVPVTDGGVAADEEEPAALDPDELVDSVVEPQAETIRRRPPSKP